MNTKPKTKIVSTDQKACINGHQSNSMKVEQGKVIQDSLEFNYQDLRSIWIDKLTDALGSPHFIQKPQTTPNTSQEIAVYYLGRGESRMSNENPTKVILTITRNLLAYETLFQVDICKVDSESSPEFFLYPQVKKMGIDRSNKSACFHTETETVEISSEGLLEIRNVD